MTDLKFEELLEAGCHFGHLKRKWNPKMAPYIFKEHNGTAKTLFFLSVNDRTGGKPHD